MKLGLVLLSLLASAPIAVAAEDLPPLTGRDVQVRLVGRPWENFPLGAQRAGVGGKVVLLCRVKADGGLEDCTAQSETPQGYGFGAAAVKSAGAFRLAPNAKDGSPTAGRMFQFDMKFGIDGY